MCAVARPAGLEPATLGLEVTRSLRVDHRAKCPSRSQGELFEPANGCSDRRGGTNEEIVALIGKVAPFCDESLCARLVICAVIAAFEGVRAGRDPMQQLRKLSQPRWSAPPIAVDSSWSLLSRTQDDGRPARRPGRVRRALAGGRHTRARLRAPSRRRRPEIVSLRSTFVQRPPVRRS